MKIAGIVGCLCWLLVTSSIAQVNEDLSSNRDRAVDRGQQYLREALTKVASDEVPYWRNSFPMGYRALVAYALLESGSAFDDPLVEKLFKILKRLKPRKTYSVSLYVLALDARWRSQQKKYEQEKPEAKKLTQMKGADRQRLKKLIRWLVASRWPGEGLWGYSPPKSRDSRDWRDYSNTQFAVLALQVGRRHGLKIKSEVFEEVGQGMIADDRGLEANASELICQGSGWWLAEQVEQVAKESAVANKIVDGFALRVPLRRWGYKRSGSWARDYCMTAAVVSSLMVVRTALVAKDQLDESELWQLDAAIGGGLIHLDRDFDRVVPTMRDTIHNNYYYTLYSLEKALDFGGVRMLGSHDWYLYHSTVLVSDQNSDGSWGEGRESEYQPVSTAFALLFLRRATLQLRTEVVAPVATGKSTGGNRLGIAHGRIFLPSLPGVVELAELFDKFASVRDLSYQKLIDEVLVVAPPNELVMLIRYLDPLRDGSGDDTERYAQVKIHELSGLSGQASRKEIQSWLAEHERVQDMGIGRPGGLNTLRQGLLDSSKTVPMRWLYIQATRRCFRLELFPELIAQFDFLPKDQHSQLSRLLEFFCREQLAANSAVRESTLKSRWQDYWQRRGGALLLDRQWNRLRSALDQSENPEQRHQLRTAIIALGPGILPRVEAIIRSESFAFDWVIIRQSLSHAGPDRILGL